MVCLCCLNENFVFIVMAVAATKSRLFSDYNLGISIPTQGQGSELLNAEEDKNDYDWLVVFLFLGISP